MSGEALLPDSQMVIFSLCSHMVERVKGLSEVSLIKSINPIHESSTHMI